jgi:putative colanic acid biosynthesis acetyltransferase WcaF
MQVNLSNYDNSTYDPGRSFLIRTIWYYINVIFFINPLFPFSGVKVNILRLFGAKVGNNVVIKPRTNIKYPWKIEIGHNSWIGENAWLDSLDQIRIGNNVCISQGAYLCTGNHDWKDESFGLITKPIIIEDGAWIGAKCVVLPGARVSSHSVLTAGAVLSADTFEFTIYSGNPAVSIKIR